MDDSSQMIDDYARLAQGGDVAAFTELVRRCERDVRCFVAAHASSLELVDEVVQSSFIACYEHLGSYEPRGTFRSWLKGIARNRLREELRERARFVALGGESLESALCQEGIDSLEAETAEDASESTRVHDCIERLPPRGRSLMLRRYRDGLPVAQLAQQFKQNKVALAKTLQRLLAAVRLCIASHGSPTP